MFLTPASLLDRLQDSGATTAWDRFVELYTPLLFEWARRLGLQDSDCADLVQDVFLLLWRKLPEFRYDATRSFHAWLKTLFLNRHRDRERARGPAAVEIDSQVLANEPGSKLAEAEYERYLIRQVFRLVEREFAPLHQNVFRAYVLEEHAPDEVAPRVCHQPRNRLQHQVQNPQPPAPRVATTSRLIPTRTLCGRLGNCAACAVRHSAACVGRMVFREYFSFFPEEIGVSCVLLPDGPAHLLATFAFALEEKI